MKKVILNVTLAAVFMIFTAGVFAQSATTPTPTAPAQGTAPAAQTQPQPPRKPLTPEERADRQTAGLTKRLNLTQDQIPKVKELFVTSIKQEEADRKTAAGDKDKFRELSKTRDDNRKAGLKKVLTPEQWEKFNAAPAQPAQKPGSQTPTPAPVPAGK